MALLISLLIGIQLFYAVVSVPLPVFLSTSCSSLEVRTAAEVALDKLNENRKEGYVLGLQRIYDVQETTEGDETAFDFLLDVLETKCHVRSRKPWRECEFRKPFETVFGPCTILIKFNRKTNDYVLHRYNCFLRPIYIPPCPVCPICRDPSEESIQEIARECLDKFNAETKTNKCFALVEVTKASSQEIISLSTIVEFIIQETFCPKDPSDTIQHPLLQYRIAEAALCKGIVINEWVLLPRDVSVECNFFPPQPSANVTATAPKQGAVVQVTGCPSSNCPISRFAEEKANTTIPPNPRGYSLFPRCPGMVAKEIPGLHLPSYSWQQAETFQRKSDV